MHFHSAICRVFFWTFSAKPIDFYLQDSNLEPKDSDVYQLITTKPGERKKQE